jgi:hypothetical protein
LQKILDRLEVTTPGQLQQLNAYFGSDFNFQSLKYNLFRIIHEKEFAKSAEEVRQELERKISDIEKEIEKDEG